MLPILEVEFVYKVGERRLLMIGRLVCYIQPHNPASADSHTHHLKNIVRQQGFKLPAVHGLDVIHHFETKPGVFKVRLQPDLNCNCIMDGVSGALAVASFGIQLVGTVQKAQRFLKEVQNAPEELANLLETLEQLESLLVDSESLVEQQRKTDTIPDRVHNITNAIRRCGSTVEKLDNSINTLAKCFETRNRGRKVWASLKTVVKKDEIEKLRAEIQQRMNNLQTALVINSTWLQLYQSNLIAVKQIKPSTTTRTSCQYDQGTPRKSSSHVYKTKDIDTWQNWGSFGKIRVRKKIKFLRTETNTLEEPISEEMCLLYVPSFLRTAFELRRHKAFSQVSRSLTCYQILPSETMETLVFGSNTSITPFKKALGRGEFSPFAKDKNGYNFLHFACYYGASELCTLLLQIGLDPGERNVYGAKALHTINRHHGTDMNTVRLLTNGGTDFGVEDLIATLGQHFCASPEILEFLLYVCDNPDLSILPIAVREYGYGNKEWRAIIQKCLYEKPDVHKRTSVFRDLSLLDNVPHPLTRYNYILSHPEFKITLLDELFVLYSDPFEAEYDAHEWLMMLAENGYDINTYLEVEKELHSGQNFLSYPECRNSVYDRARQNKWEEGFYMHRQLKFDIGDHPKVSWDWWIDPLSCASLVRQEFRHMNSFHRDLFVGMRVHYIEDDKHDWRATWPFFYPPWSENCEPPHHESRRREWRKWRKRADQAARRHARQARKKYPGDFEHKEKLGKIPGDWIEDDF